jgi:hypothetical protein
VTFNGLNTYKWFKDNTRYLDAGHDTGDRAAAFARAIADDKLALGVFYVEEGRPAFDEACGAYATDPRPLWSRGTDMGKLQALAERLGRGA